VAHPGPYSVVGAGHSPRTVLRGRGGMHDAKTLKYELNLNSSRKQSERESLLNIRNVVVDK